MIRTILIVLMLCGAVGIRAQSIRPLADSIRIAYKIPALGYAVVGADSVYETGLLGVRKINTTLSVTNEDRFRIGSNTKAITAFIAALLVKQGKLSWDTKFFDLFPEMKNGAGKEYRQLTLLDLLTFRTRLFKYTYTYAEPRTGWFSGNDAEQRYQFTQWFFKHKPAPGNDSINFSNLGYVAAGLMLEKASGRSYKQLVADLGNTLGITFGFGRPNAADSLQTWGHNASLIPESAGDDQKLEWLLAAGNINCSLPDYAKFIQLQLKGLNGQSELLTRQEFEFLHYGRTRFSLGWFPAADSANGAYTWNIGNPGTFLTKVYVYKDIGRAFILFANAQTDAADTGLDILYEALKEKYGR